jgi:hypothetical protein
MSELSAVLALFALIALLASRIAREQGQNSARKHAGSMVDEPPETAQARDKAIPHSISLATTKHAAGQH